MPRRPPPRPYHHGDLPRAIHEAALALITEVGPDGFTLREVARRVGVSHAAPYRHFTDKRALMNALAAEGSRRMGDAIQEALEAAGPDLRARFLAASHAYVRFSIDQPAYFKVLFFASEVDSTDPDVVAARDRTFGLLLTFIAEAQAAGFFGPCEPMEVAIAIWSMHHGLASLAAIGAFPTAGPALRAASDAAHARLLDGLVPRPPSAAKKKKTPRA
jgi:AcrR family transcriptional regulator